MEILKMQMREFMIFVLKKAAGILSKIRPWMSAA